MQKFWAKVDMIVPLSPNGKALINEITTVKNLAKGDLLLAEGAVCNHLYFIEKGLVRIFYIKNDKEITEWIGLDDNFCFSILSFFDKSPSRLIIECIENSEIVYLSRNGLMQLSETNLEVAAFFRQLITGSLILSQIRMESIQFETAQQRYRKLLQQNPEIIRRVPLMYIASFLGVSFETLSRIRANYH